MSEPLMGSESPMTHEVPGCLLSNLDDEARRALAASVSDDFRRWKQARAQLECKWRECWEAYLCDVKGLYTEPDGATPDRSRIARPVLYESVEAIHSNLMNHLFPASERFFTVIGKTEADQVHAHTIEEYLQNKLEETGFLEKFSLFLKQAVITGNTVAAVPWKRLTEVRRIDQAITLLGVTIGYQKIPVEQIVFNGPDLEVIDIFDFVLDPDASDFDSANVIRKVERSLSELQSNPAYSYLEALNPTHEIADADDANKQSRRRAFGIDEAIPATGKSPNTVKLLEAWGDFTVGDTIYRNHVCVVANDSTVIRFEPNPYDCGRKPFIFSSFIPVPNELYGISAIEKSLGLQHAINTLTNQKLDVINLSINSPFTYLINDDVFDPENMVTRPGALIPVKSHETLRPISYLNNFTVAFTEIGDLKNEIQEATGALKYFTGAEGDTQRTATEVSALLNGGSQKFSSFLSHLEHSSLLPLLKLVFEQARQFVHEPESLRTIGSDGCMRFKEISPDVLKSAECAFRVDGSRGLLFKEKELQSIGVFLKMVENSPALRGQVNLLALYKKVYRRLGFTDEAEIFGKPTEGGLDVST